MKVRLHDSVLDTLGRSIVEGSFPQEAALPHETVLCKEYGIGRNTLREVFKVLAAKGMITATPKKGTWVKPESDWDLFDGDIIRWSVNTPLLTTILTDLSDARILIEPASAFLAAKKAKISDLAAMDSAFARMNKTTAASEEGMLSDIEFHLALFKASHNSLWIKFGKIVANALIQIFHKVNAAEGFEGKYQIALKQHRSVIEAIRIKDAETARDVMKKIVEESRANLLSILK